MTTTIIKPSYSAIRVESPLLPQVTDRLADRASLAGKNAYAFLLAVRERTASEIAKDLSSLTLSSIGKRDLSDSVGAALAVAAAALLDGSRGKRLTGAERIDLALDLLDEELSAGW